MGKKANSKSKKTISTKKLEGRRINGVLYLDRGVGLGRFSNINSTSPSFDNSTGSSGQVIKNCNNDEGEY